MRQHSQQLQFHYQREVEKILQRPGNNVCAECPARHPTWAALLKPALPSISTITNTTTLAVFCCQNCYRHHYELGRNHCDVKSLSRAVTEWSTAEIAILARTGNQMVNAIYEANLVVDEENEWHNDKEIITFDKKEAAGARRKFIRNKYIHKKYFSKEKYHATMAQLNPHYKYDSCNNDTSKDKVQAHAAKSDQENDVNKHPQKDQHEKSIPTATINISSCSHSDLAVPTEDLPSIRSLLGLPSSMTSSATAVTRVSLVATRDMSRQPSRQGLLAMERSASVRHLPSDRSQRRQSLSSLNQHHPDHQQQQPRDTRELRTALPNAFQIVEQGLGAGGGMKKSSSGPNLSRLVHIDPKDDNLSRLRAASLLSAGTWTRRPPQVSAPECGGQSVRSNAPRTGRRSLLVKNNSSSSLRSLGGEGVESSRGRRMKMIKYGSARSLLGDDNKERPTRSRSRSSRPSGSRSTRTSISPCRGPTTPRSNRATTTTTTTTTTSTFPGLAMEIGEEKLKTAIDALRSSAHERIDASRTRGRHQLLLMSSDHSSADDIFDDDFSHSDSDSDSDSDNKLTKPRNASSTKKVPKRKLSKDSKDEKKAPPLHVWKKLPKDPLRDKKPAPSRNVTRSLSSGSIDIDYSDRPQRCLKKSSAKPVKRINSEGDLNTMDSDDEPVAKEIANREARVGTINSTKKPMTRCYDLDDVPDESTRHSEKKTLRRKGSDRKIGRKISGRNVQEEPIEGGNTLAKGENSFEHTTPSSTKRYVSLGQLEGSQDPSRIEKRRTDRRLASEKSPTKKMGRSKREGALDGMSDKEQKEQKLENGKSIPKSASSGALGLLIAKVNTDKVQLATKKLRQSKTAALLLLEGAMKGISDKEREEKKLTMSEKYKSMTTSVSTGALGLLVATATGQTNKGTLSPAKSKKYSKVLSSNSLRDLLLDESESPKSKKSSDFDKKFEQFLNKTSVTKKQSENRGRLTKNGSFGRKDDKLLSKKSGMKQPSSSGGLSGLTSQKTSFTKNYQDEKYKNAIVSQWLVTQTAT